MEIHQGKVSAGSTAPSRPSRKFRTLALIAFGPAPERERRRKLNLELAMATAAAQRRPDGTITEWLHCTPTARGPWIPSPDQRNGPDRRASVSGVLLLLLRSSSVLRSQPTDFITPNDGLRESLPRRKAPVACKGSPCHRRSETRREDL